MKQLHLTLSLLFPLLLNAQIPTWQWAMASGGSANDRGGSVAFNKATGESVATGFYDSEGISFGPFSLMNTLNNSTSDIFLAKYGANGTVVWAKTFGTSGSDRGTGVCIDATGNIYLTGFFDAPFITFETETLNTNGETDFFLVKFDPAGNVVWAKGGGGGGNDYPQGITTDPAGNIFITGYHKSSVINFGPDTLVNANPNSSDIFVAKYSSSGAELWARASGGAGEDITWSISADGNGDAVIAGNFRSGIFYIDAIVLNNPSPSGYEAIVFKYDAAGTFMWVNQYGSIYAESFLDVTTDSAGNVAATGYFEAANLTVGPVVLTNSTAFSFLDIFVVKFSPSGNVMWAKSAGGTRDEYPFCISFDKSGNVFVSGYYDSDTCAFGADDIFNSGGFDAFLAKYDAAGNDLWAMSAGGGGSDRALDLDVNNSGEAIVTGYFTSSSIAFGTTVINNEGDNDQFIAKLNPVTGIENIFYDDLFQVYQSRNEIVVAGKKGLEEVKVYSATGQLIFESFPETERVQVLLQTPGIYFLTAKSGSSELSKKVIVK
jgi:hypothetical protein